MSASLLAAVTAAVFALAPPAAPPTPDPARSLGPQEAAYVSTIRTKAPELSSLSDEVLIGLGKAVCADLDANGGDAVRSAKQYVGEGGAAGPVVLVMSAAITSFCPQYSGQVPRLQAEVK